MYWIWSLYCREPDAGARGIVKGATMHSARPARAESRRNELSNIVQMRRWCLNMQLVFEKSVSLEEEKGVQHSGRRLHEA